METAALPDPGPVELTIPADARLLRLARLTASGLASDLSFSVDEIEELRLAVTEVCAALVDQARPDATLHLRYVVDGTELVIEGSCPTDGSTATLDPVAELVLKTTVDRYELEQDGERGCFRLVKRATGAP